MASNKKPKADFRDALAAKAKKIVPKLSEDEVEEEYLANIDGEDVRFLRGTGADRMSDAAWEKIKKNPAAVQRVAVRPSEGSKSPANIVVTVRKPGESDEDWRKRASQYESHPRYDSTVETTEADQRAARREEYKRLIANEAYEGGDGALVSKDELKLLRRMNPDAAADFIEERLKKKEILDEAKREEQKKTEPSTQANEKPAPLITPSGTGGNDLGMMKPDQGSPETDFKSFPEPAISPSGGTQTEDDVHVGMGGNMRNPASFVPQMAMGATGNPMLDDIQEVAQPVVDSVKRQIAGPPMVERPGLEGGWARFQQKMSELEADGPPLPGQPIPEGRNPDGTKKVTMADAVPGAESPPMPVDPSMGPGNVSASLGVTMPGGYKPAEMDPKFAKQLDTDIAAARKRADDLAELQAANEVVQDGLVREAGKRRLEAEAEMNREASLAAQARLNAANEAARYNGARQSALAEAQKAAATPTDPNRFWNNKTAGQQAAAVIAGALFGFTGQGMQWLQRIDGLIEADNRLQVADRAAKVQGLESKARGFGEAADFAMRSGASEAEAHIIARQMKYEGLKSYLEQVAMRSQNMQQKVQAQQMMMAIDQQIVGLDMQAKQANAMEVAQKNENLFRNAQLAQGRAELAIKATAASAKGSGSPLPAPVSRRLDDVLGAYQNVMKMADLAKNGGMGDRIIRGLKETTPGAVVTDSNEKASNDLYEQLKVNLMKYRAGSALQSHEVKMLEPITGGSRSGVVNSEPGLRKTADYLRKEAMRTIQSEAAAGRDVSQYVNILQSLDAESGASTPRTFRPQ